MKLIRTTEVAVDAARAFEAFTDEIGEWYRSGPHSWNDPERAVGIKFEGGRLLELYDEGEPFVMGVVTAWEPGVRLAFEFRSVTLPPEARTEVEVRFEPIEGGTRVSLEHRGLERIPAVQRQRTIRTAWAPFMQWYRDYVGGL